MNRPRPAAPSLLGPALLLLLCVLPWGSLYGQTPTGAQPPIPGQGSAAATPGGTIPGVATPGGTSPATAAPGAAAQATLKPLPTSFRELSLGMSLEDLKTALSADSLFAFRGDRDVSLLPVGNQVLVETTGLSFVRRAFFQLKDGKVIIMAFDLDPGKVDHYSVFTTFVSNYGEPATLDPQEAVWLSDAVRVSVERPLTVKYIDRVAFDELSRDSKVKESREYVLRKEFLNGF